MRNLKANLLVSTILLLSLVVLGFAQKNTNGSDPPRRLALQIGLNTPMTVNAGNEGSTLKAYLRIPSDANGESRDSAVKLEPKMVGNNLEVKVTTLSGDTSAVKSCTDWAKLNVSNVTSYTLKEGEEVTISKLPDLGSNFKDGKLTFRAVAAIALQARTVEPCCASCGGSTCCPGVGNCLSCGGCGSLCC
jgi:hypothetical protein